MKSLLVRVSVLLALLSSTVATGQEKNGVRRPTKQIRLYFTPDNWMHLYDDGAGAVGFGAGGSYQVFFQAGTFDYDQVEKELRSLKTLAPGDPGARCRFSFSTDPKRENKRSPVYATTDRESIASLFQKGIESHAPRSGAFDRSRPFLLGQVAAFRMADTWVVESAQSDGRALAGLTGAKIVIGRSGNQGELTETVGGKERKVQMEIAPHLLSTAEQFEWTAYVGEPLKEKRLTIYGVYALAGDELRIRRSGSATTVLGIEWDVAAEQPAGKPPKSLDANEGVLLVLKREKK